MSGRTNGRPSPETLQQRRPGATGAVASLPSSSTSPPPPAPSQGGAAAPYRYELDDPNASPTSQEQGPSRRRGRRNQNNSAPARLRRPGNASPASAASASIGGVGAAPSSFATSSASFASSSALRTTFSGDEEEDEEDEDRHYESSLYRSGTASSHESGNTSRSSRSNSRSRSIDEDDDGSTSCSGSSSMMSDSRTSRSSVSRSVATSSLVSSRYHDDETAGHEGEGGATSTVAWSESAYTTRASESESAASAAASMSFESPLTGTGSAAAVIATAPTGTSLPAPPSLAADSTILSTDSFRNQTANGGASMAGAVFLHHRPDSFSPLNAAARASATASPGVVASPVSSTAMTQRVVKMKGALAAGPDTDPPSAPKGGSGSGVNVPDLTDEAPPTAAAARSPTTTMTATPNPPSGPPLRIGDNVENDDEDKKDEDDDDNHTDTTQPTSPGRGAPTTTPSLTKDRVPGAAENSTYDAVVPSSMTPLSPSSSSPPSLTFDAARLKDRKQEGGEGPALGGAKLSSPSRESLASSPSRADRIPGGAAAKLLLVGSASSAVGLSQDSEAAASAEKASIPFHLRVSTTHESDETFEASLREIEMTLKLAKREFEMGSPANRRYHSAASLSPTKVTWSDDANHESQGRHEQADGSEADLEEEDDDDDVPGDASSYTPSFLNRDHVFFASAAAAISALLTPRSAADPASAGAGAGVAPAASDAASAVAAAAAASQGPTTSGSPGRKDPSDGGAAAVVVTTASSTGSAASAFQTPSSSSAQAARDPSLVSFGRVDVSSQLLTERTEKKIETMPKRMHDPNKTLTDLLTAIATPDNKEVVDMGFMVRRKNACGALKVMTNDPKKRSKMCWTVGVLPALTSVLAEGTDPVLASTVFDSDQRIRDEYDAARNRAISALLNLSIPKANRIPIFHTPGLVQALLGTVRTDAGEARKGCTAILAYLARTPENRLLMVQVPGFSEGIVSVLKPVEPSRTEEDTSSSEKKNENTKKYPWALDSDSESESPSKTQRERGGGGGGGGPSRDEDSDRTPLITPSRSPHGDGSTDNQGTNTKGLTGYDEVADECLRASRQHVFAVLSHVIKEKDNAYHFARDTFLLSTVVAVAVASSSFSSSLSREDLENEVPSGSHHHGDADNADADDNQTATTSSSHALSIQFLAHLTRHRLNTKLLVFQERRVVPVLVQAAHGRYEAASRLHACRALQNLAQDKACRQELAGLPNLVSTLCARGRYAVDARERLSAISALKNLTDEPANLIPLTNTPACIATLMHLAHGRERGVTELMQYRACDALATLSHWLRKIATSGQALHHSSGGIGAGASGGGGATATASTVSAPASLSEPPPLFVPSLRVVTWNQWE